MKFSIITITHNRAHLIGETIQSVLDQTFSDFEHIIIDDGSTDDTENVVNSFSDDRIKYYKYSKNGLRSFLRNEGIRKAKGELICILDSDDIWTNDKLETIHHIFCENLDINFVIHNISFIPKNVKIDEVFSTYKSNFYKNILSDLFDDKILPFPIFTIKKSALNQIGYIDENMIDGQHDLYLRVASKFKVYYCTKKLTFIRKHDQNISQKIQMSHYLDHIKTIDKLNNQKLISLKIQAILKTKIYTKTAYIYNKQKLPNKAKENYLKAFQTKFFCYNGLKSLVMYWKISFKLYISKLIL